MMDALALERSRLRAMMMARRDLLSSAALLARSERIAAALLAHPLFRQKQIICIYCHFRSEVRTASMIDMCLGQGKIVCVPVCLPQETGMAAVAITDPAQDLAPGYRGIPEPQPLLVRTGTVAPATIEAAVIPGTVFDRNGHRLGYGKGFYDRFLVRTPNALRIGLAFSCQVVERLPTREHDIPMDMLVTEEEVMVWPERPHAPDRGL